MDHTPETPAREAYHHGALKEALVDAGIAMLEDVGLERLSLRGIAARVGVSHTAPKNHFAGLRGLLSAIAAEGFRRHAAAMTEGIGPTSTRLERLHAAAEGYVSFALANPALFRLMFTPGLLEGEDPALKAAGGDSYGVLSTISEGLDWVALDGSPATQARTELMLWSMVHGYAHLLTSKEIGGTGKRTLPPVASVMPRLRYLEE